MLSRLCWWPVGSCAGSSGRAGNGDARLPRRWRLPRRRIWVAGGIPYAGALGIAPVVLRSDDWDGFLAVMFLFAIVWATDIVGYFVGRAIGGPKLMPNVSPKKTWSGALGGTLAATVAAVVVGKFGGADGLVRGRVACGRAVGFRAGGGLVRILSQAQVRRQGFEPSHPRPWGLDGSPRRFRRAPASVAAVIGLARGGFEAPGRGLLVW